jgi:calmodulin
MPTATLHLTPILRTRFLAVMAGRLQQPDSPDEVVERLRAYDHHGDGTISVEDLRHVVTTLGERPGLSDGEVNDIVAAAEVDVRGRVCIDAFVAMMMAK